MIFHGDANEVAAHLRRNELTVEIESDNVIAITTDPGHMPETFNMLSTLKDFSILDVDIRKPNLEDAFLHLSRAGGHAFSGEDGEVK